MPVFLVPSQSIDNGIVTITGPLLDHLRASLRTRVGEELWVGDERRRRYRIRVVDLDRHRLRGRIVEQVTGNPPIHPAIILAPALLKSDRMDWIVQKATELGVDVIVPLASDRAVVRPRAERVHLQQQRWQRIAREASQQSERWDVPTVSLPCSTAEFFRNHEGTSVKLMLSERHSGDSLGHVSLPATAGTGIAVAVGPEGGWEQQEIAAAVRHGFVPVTLGSRILRADTAALAALAIIQSRLGELG